MNEIDKIDLEKALLMVAKASPETASELISYFERLKLQKDDSHLFDKFLNILRDKLSNNSVPGNNININRLPSVSRVFFEPYSAIFESRGKDKLLTGSFEREVLGKIWDVITKISDPELFNRISTNINENILSNRYDLARKNIAELTIHIGKIIAKSGGDIFSQKDTQISNEISNRFCNLVKLYCIAYSKGILLNTNLEKVSPAVYNNICNLFKELDKNDQDKALEFLLLLMENSSKPWGVMRVIKNAHPKMNDKMLETTKYSIIPQRLFAKIEYLLKHFSDSRINEFNGYMLALEVDEFSKLTLGLEREEIAELNGFWHKKIYDCRSRLSQYLTDLFQRAAASVEKALNLERVIIAGKGNLEMPCTNNPINPARFSSLIEFAIFIRKVQLFAPLTGLNTVRDTSLKDMQNRLDLLQNGLMTQIAIGKKGDYFDDWLKAVLKLTTEIDDANIAKAYEKRIMLQKSTS